MKEKNAISINETFMYILINDFGGHCSKYCVNDQKDLMFNSSWVYCMYQAIKSIFPHCISCIACNKVFH